jgi:P27 family predicted phage terminase small subunit
MGRKAKPNHLKILDGNPGRTPINSEPVPCFDMPQPPSFLDAYAVEEWNRKVEGIHAMGILAEIDDTTLAAYCVSYSVWRAADEALQGRVAELGPLAGLVETTQNGNAVKHCLVVTRNKAAADMVKYASAFGMNPTARATMGIKNGPKPKSKFEGLIGGKAKK